MRIRTKIQKWGNSLGLRVSGALRDIPHFREGTKVEINVTEEGLTIKKLSSRSKKLALPYSENELLADMTPEKAHADSLAILNRREMAE